MIHIVTCELQIHYTFLDGLFTFQVLGFWLSVSISKWFGFRLLHNRAQTHVGLLIRIPLYRSAYAIIWHFCQTDCFHLIRWRSFIFPSLSSSDQRRIKTFIKWSYHISDPVVCNDVLKFFGKIEKEMSFQTNSDTWHLSALRHWQLPNTQTHWMSYTEIITIFVCQIDRAIIRHIQKHWIVCFLILPKMLFSFVWTIL